MAESRFVYVIYIRAPAEKIWEALTTPEMNRAFWGGYSQETSWRVGEAFRIVDAHGKAWDEGEVLAFEPHRRIEVTWRHLHDPALAAEGVSRMRFELEPQPEGETRLTLVHEIDRPDSKLIGAVGQGWPQILSRLKSLLETGRAV